MDLNLKTNGSEQIRNLVHCNLKKDGIPEGSGLTVTVPSIRVMAIESDKRGRIKNQESSFLTSKSGWRLMVFCAVGSRLGEALVF